MPMTGLCGRTPNLLSDPVATSALGEGAFSESRCVDLKTRVSQSQAVLVGLTLNAVLSKPPRSSRNRLFVHDIRSCCQAA